MDRDKLLRRSAGKGLIFFLLVLLMFSLGTLRPAGAEKAIDPGSPFTVDIGDDTIDLFPGDGYCIDLQDNCSLRAAIQESNALAGDDTINIPLSNVTLSLTGHSEDAGATGDLDIIDNLTIIGNGATNIDGDGIDRVIQVHEGITVTLQALAVINGRTADDAEGSHRHGGGIYNGASNLILQGVEVISNETSDGIITPGDHHVGGFGGGIFNSGNLVLNSSQVRNNSTGDGYTGHYYGGDGGGLYIAAGAKLTMNDSSVYENTTGMGGGNTTVGAPGGRGGGIYIDSGSATADLTNSYVSNNTTGNGGSGIVAGQTGGAGGAGGGIFFVGDLLLLTNSYVTGNVTGNGGAGDNDRPWIGVGGPGGGIYAGVSSSAGNVTLSSSTVNNNRTGAAGAISATGAVGANGATGGNGGGIHSARGNLTLLNSLVTGNSTGNGAADDRALGTAGQGGNGAGISLYNATLMLMGSQVINNHTGDGGYGLYQGGDGGHGGGIYGEESNTLEIASSTISGNSTGDGGNGGSFARRGGWGGGIYLFTGSAILNQSTVNNNWTGQGGGPAPQGVGGLAGGIYSKSVLTLNNSTVSGNTTGPGGAVGGSVGGIYAAGTTYLNNSTISHNAANRNIGGIQTVSTVYANGTIIANNSAPGGLGPDCYHRIESQGYNLIENTKDCSIEGDTTGNITGQDPNLGLLQNNGGPTLTHALLSGSIAIDAGNPSACPATDQRGYGRPVDGNGDSSAVCDIGAFESQTTESTTVPGLSESVPLTFGATMATLTRQTASTDPLTTTVTLRNEAPGGGAPDPGEMPLLWTIDAAVSSGLDLDLELCYTDDQLGSLVELDLEIYRYDGSGWVNMGGTVHPDDNCVTLDGVTELSDWTLATASPVEEKPIAVSDHYTTTEDITLEVPAPGVLENDSDVDGGPLSAVLDSSPSDGDLALESDGSFVYTPTLHFNGTDTFTYYANEGQLNSNTVVVTLTVVEVSDPEFELYLPMVIK